MGLKDGIVLDMNFREGTGTETRDKSGGDHVGTLVGGPTWVSGGGITFAVGKTVTIPSNNSFDITGKDFSVEVYIYTAVDLSAQSNDYPVWFDRANWPGNEGFSVQYSKLQGKMVINAKNAGGWIGLSSIRTSFPAGFYHVVGIFHINGDKELYINGLLDNSSSTGFPDNATGDTVGISSNFDGTVYGARFWIDNALSEQEVRHAYEQWKTPKFEDGIVLDMDFREGAGTVTHDKSENQNHGTLAGPPDWVAGGGLDFDHSDNNNKVALDSTILVSKDEGAIVILYESDFDFTVNFDSKGTLIGLEGYVFNRGLTVSYGNGVNHGLKGETNLNSEYFTSQPVISALIKNTRHIVVCSLDSGVCKTYVDGRYIWIETGITNGISLNQLGGFDAGGNDVFFDGIIYKVRIYDRPLSEQEVKHLTEKWLNS